METHTNVDRDTHKCRQRQSQRKVYTDTDTLTHINRESES